MIFTKHINRDNDGNRKEGDNIVRYVTTGVGGDAVIGASKRSVMLAGQYPAFKTEREIHQFIEQLHRAWIQHVSLEESGTWLTEQEITRLLKPELQVSEREHAIALEDDEMVV